MPPAAATAEAATCHYRAGRYRLASDAFAAAADGGEGEGESSGGASPGAPSRKRRRGGVGPSPSLLFSALPRLAAAADAALSAVRSASAATGGAPRGLVGEALERSGRHRHALLSASMALRRAGSGGGGGGGGGAEVLRRQAAAAALMSGVSAAWLHMAQASAGDAGRTMAEALRLAASCFWDDGDDDDVLPPSMLPVAEAEAYALLRRGFAGFSSPSAEEERGRFALGTFLHASRAVALAGGGGPPPPAADRPGSAAGGPGPAPAQELLVLALSSKGEEERNGLLAAAAKAEGFPLGPAGRLRALLDGAAVLSSPSPPGAPGPVTRGTVEGLARLSKTDRTACALLAAIRGGRLGDHQGALGCWQLCLAMDERGGSGSGSGSGTAAAAAADRRPRDAVLGAADCFAALGAAKPALELLLHLLAPEPLGTTKKDGASPGLDLRPLTLTLSAGGIDAGSGSCQVCPRRAADERRDLLWRLFHVSTLAEDWATALAAAEELLSKGAAGAEISNLRCSLAFALLQCHQPSLVLDKVEGWKEVDGNGADGDFGVLLNLYEADARIVTELEFFSDAGVEVSNGARKVCAACEAATDMLGQRSACELRIAAQNNLGVALILAGKPMEALDWFKKASLAVSASGHSKGAHERLLLRPRFNLALLLWRDGHRDEAAEIWIKTRKLISRRVGDSQASQRRDLRAAMDKAITCHGLLHGRRGSAVGNPGKINLPSEHITPWQPPNSRSVSYTGEADASIGGLSMGEMFAFDCAVLQHAVVSSSKSKPKTFR